jgi:hypothetical protein
MFLLNLAQVSRELIDTSKLLVKAATKPARIHFATSKTAETIQLSPPDVI